MKFASRHSERSEESTDLNKEAEKLFLPRKGGGTKNTSLAPCGRGRIS